jgi:hypothetical protein
MLLPVAYTFIHQEVKEKQQKSKHTCMCTTRAPFDIETNLGNQTPSLAASICK